MIYCIMGNSGAGKSTVTKKLLQRSDLDLHKIMQVTTRPKRDGEIDGDEYYFISDIFFREMSTLEIITCVQLIKGEWYYGILQEIFDYDKYDYIIPASTQLFKLLYNATAYNSVLPIVLYVDDHNRKQRMLAHNDDPDEVNRRFTNDEHMVNFTRIHPQFIIDNSKDLENTVGTIATQIYNNKQFLRRNESLRWQLNPDEREITGDTLFDAVFESFIK